MRFIQEFKKFAMRGSLVDLAIGFTVGAAFTTVAKSLVTDVIMPPIGLLLGGADFADMFFVLREGPDVKAPYDTLAAAQQAGAVTLNYGVFLSNVIALLIVALAMFMLIRAMNKADDLMDEEADEKQPAAAPTPETPPNKKCPYCRETISYKATRCAFCTSQLEPEAKAETDSPRSESDAAST